MSSEPSQTFGLKPHSLQDWWLALFFLLDTPAEELNLNRIAKQGMIFFLMTKNKNRRKKKKIKSY